MEFSIDIHTGLNGKVTIEDYSNEYDQYFPEDQMIQEYGRYKYSDCKTLNVIMKVNSNKIALIDVLLHDHDQIVEDPMNPGTFLYDLEVTNFNLAQDGYYNVNHIILIWPWRLLKTLMILTPLHIQTMYCDMWGTQTCQNTKSS